MLTSEELKPHEPDYKPQAWEAYTLAELGWWCHLFAKRAGMRSATGDGQAKGFFAYKRDVLGGNLLICECCAAEEGHIWEADETPETSPVCHRKPKEKLR